jgi:hypothetical protein
MLEILIVIRLQAKMAPRGFVCLFANLINLASQISSRFVDGRMGMSVEPIGEFARMESPTGFQR